MNKVFRSILLLVAAAVLSPRAALADAATATSDAAVSDTSTSGLAEIIVTARKRSEPEQRTPVSMTAFSPEILAAKSITTINDIAYHSSGLTLQESSTTQQFEATIRGQNTLDSTLNLDPAIGIYVDGVYIGPDIGNAIALNFDDAAIAEVLKGPQGTLYGRNTSGGAIKLDHMLPDYDGVKGWAKGTLGAYNLSSFSGAVTLPIVDNLATIRLYGRYISRDGFGMNTTLNMPVQDDHGYDFGITLRLDPAPGFRIVIRGNYDKDHSGGPSIHPVADTLNPYSIENNAIQATLNGLPRYGLTAAQATAAQAAYFALGPKNYYDMTSRFPTPNYLMLYNGSVTVDYEVSEALQIKSISGYRHISTYRGIDFSGTAAASDITVQEPLTYRQFTEEFTVGGVVLGDKLNYTLGAFYLNSSGEDDSSAATAPVLGQALGAGSPIPTGLNMENGLQENKSYAGYGQASYRVLPNLNFTAGVRYTKERKDLTSYNQFQLGAYNPATGFVDPYPPVLNQTVFCPEPNKGVGKGCFGFGTNTFSKTTFLASLDYKITDGVMTYAKFSQGFRSGGGQLRLGAGITDNGKVVPPFAPETVNDYEVGIKSDWFDHTLRINAAYYYDDYRNLQKTFLEVVNGALNSVVLNAATAKIQGVEFDVSYKPISQLTLGISGAYTDPKYSKYVDPTTGADLSGQKFQGVAKMTFTASAGYNVPTDFGSVDLNLDYWHTSAVPLQPGAGDNQLGTAPWDTQPAYGLFNGRLAVNLDKDHWTIAAWSKNIFNKNYFTYALDLTASTSLGYAVAWGAVPRTWGVDATYRF
jgi:iron complex outermembrane receptor protein